MSLNGEENEEQDLESDKDCILDQVKNKSDNINQSISKFQRKNEPNIEITNQIQKTDQNNNNFYTLNFENVVLCLPIFDCNKNTQCRKPSGASESSTIFDTYSSTSSSSSTTSNFENKNLLSIQEITDNEKLNFLLTNDNLEKSNTELKICNELAKNNVNQNEMMIVPKVKISRNKNAKIVKKNINSNVNSNNDKIENKIGLNNDLMTGPILNDGIDLQPILEPYYTQVYTCMYPNCGMEMSLQADLLVHLKETHKIEESIDAQNIPSKMGRLSYKCIYDNQKCICGKKLENLNKIANHICKTHLNKTAIKFISPQNNETIESITNNDSNPTESTNNPENFFYFNNILICSYNECLWSFQLEKALKTHKLEHKQPYSKVTEPEKNHSCHICSSKFARPSHLKTHMKSHIGFKCDYCDETFPKHSNLLSHVFEKHKLTDKIYKCHYEGCNKSYLCKMYLSSHITKSHLKQPPSEMDKTCTDCNIKFSTIWLKRQHDENEHNRKTEVKVYKCSFENCNKEFSTSSKLHRHSLTHVKLKKFKCDFNECNAEFSRQDHLMNHVKFHDDQKLYECDHPNCRSSFKYQNNLITHKKTHTISKNETSESNDLFIIDANNSHYNTETTAPILSQNHQNIRKRKKSVYQEFKPIIQVTTDEENISNNQNEVTEPGFNNENEFKCQSCLFKFSTNEELVLHLKSHFDVNKANEKLNDYLLVEPQTDLIKYNIDLDQENFNNHQYIQENSISSSNNNNQVIRMLLTSTTNPDTLNNPKNHVLNNSEYMFNANINKNDNKNDNNTNENNNLKFNNENNNVNKNEKFLVQLDEDCGLSKYNHIININSDDEENVICSVVLENLSGSARTDYKSNHIYIEKYKAKRKNANNMLINDNLIITNKRIKLSECSDDLYDHPIPSGSSTSSMIFSPVSVPTTLVSTPSKKKRAKPQSQSTNSTAIKKKSSYKRKTNLQKSQSMSMSFQSDLSSLQESLISQTSLQC